MAFAGYLMKAVSTNTVFPNKYIQYESWDTTPNQREEIKAWRDENTRDLFRITAHGKKSKIEFTTMPSLHLADKMAIQSFFTDAESNSDERKIRLEYWNDESNTYEVGDFYRPDIKFSIKMVTDSDIVYKELSIHLVEY